MKQVLFVCLGNICRSPSAEAVFNASIGKNGLEKEVSCDSAGIAAYHEGEPAGLPDETVCAKAGLPVDQYFETGES